MEVGEDYNEILEEVSGFIDTHIDLSKLGE